MALILTTPAGFGTASNIIIRDILVPPLTTTTVDSASIINIPTIKWVVTITNTDTNQTVSQEILANYSNTVTTHTRYAITGSLIPHTINVVSDITGTLLYLEITNPTTDPYSVDIVR